MAECRYDEDPDDGPDVKWVYQYNFKVRKKQRGRPRLAMYLDYEFRLCWDGESSIVRPDGSKLHVPIIVVKGNNRESISTLIPFASPTERNGEVGDYRVLDRLAWRSDDTIAWAYAVPLCSIESDEEVKTELVIPIRVLLGATDATVKQIEPVAFKSALHVLRWKDHDGKVLLAG
jgi:hypothetical protein